MSVLWTEKIVTALRSFTILVTSQFLLNNKIFATAYQQNLISKHSGSMLLNCACLLAVSSFLQKQSLEDVLQKGVVKIFAKVTRKYLHHSLSFNKVAESGPTTLVKRDTSTSVFLWTFLRPFFIKHLEATYFYFSYTQLIT